MLVVVLVVCVCVCVVGCGVYVCGCGWVNVHVDGWVCVWIGVGVRVDRCGCVGVKGRVCRHESGGDLRHCNGRGFCVPASRSLGQYRRLHVIVSN